jgi:RNA polymerase sigma-70 factor (ECF subfamily)
VASVLNGATVLLPLPRGVGADAVPWDEVVTTVHRQMRSLVGPTPELEDLAQVALEKVARGLEGFEGRSELATFTYRVSVRVACNHWRSWRRWLARFEAWGERSFEQVPSTDEGDVPERLVEIERRRRLHAALARLSPKKRVVLTLVDLDEVPVADVALILECPAPTVRSRLAVARRELYEILRKDPFFTKEGAR